MVVWETVIEISRIDHTCTVYEDVQFWLILVFSILVHGLYHVQLVFVLVKLDELGLDGFNEVLNERLKAILLNLPDIDSLRLSVTPPQ